MSIKIGFGKDIHRFASPDTSKPCQIGGATFDEVPGFLAKSDGDVVYHALCHAITSVTMKPILGVVSKELLEKDGITDSSRYVVEALKTLEEMAIVHIAISLEAMRPRIGDRADEIRANIAHLTGISMESVGVTAHTSDGLTDVGCGSGVRCSVVITVETPN